MKSTSRLRLRRREVPVTGGTSVYQLYEPPLAVARPPFPVVLFLHGAGESGSDGLAQTTVGIGPAIRTDPERFPALVVFPQASRGYGWRGVNLAAAAAALDDVESSRDIDPDRVYVTGISMGGYGTWLLALQQAERFAALVPVCGGLDRAVAIRSGVVDPAPAHSLVTQAAARLSGVPHWVFHGADDDIVPAQESRVMVHALRAAGATVRHTEYPGVGHNSWDRAYAEPELMPWLLAQTRPAESRSMRSSS